MLKCTVYVNEIEAPASIGVNTVLQRPTMHTASYLGTSGKASLIMTEGGFFLPNIFVERVCVITYTPCIMYNWAQ